MKTDGPDTTNTVFELKKIGKQFGSDPAIHALVDVDLRLERGEWLSITGPSGAGKSTLLNVLGCLDRPTSGSYFLDGIDTAMLSGRDQKEAPESTIMRLIMALIELRM